MADLGTLVTEAGGRADAVLGLGSVGTVSAGAMATALGDARNALVVRAADAVLAIGGRGGTLSEIALAAKMGIPVGLLGVPPAKGLDLPAFEEPARAIAWALSAARSRRDGRQ